MIWNRTGSTRTSSVRPILLGAFALTLFAIPALAQAAKPLAANPQLSIATNPSSVVSGRNVTITGRLKGNQGSNAAQGIVLQANPHPFAGYVNGSATTTDANGNYTIVTTVTVNTRYRAQTTTANPVETSGEVTVNAAYRVSFKLSDRTPRRGQLVRFYGTVSPANDGVNASIQRRTSTGAWRTVARTALRDDGATRSKYSRRIRIRSNGTYRVLAPASTSNTLGTSSRRSALVH